MKCDNRRYEFPSQIIYVAKYRIVRIFVHLGIFSSRHCLSNPILSISNFYKFVDLNNLKVKKRKVSFRQRSTSRLLDAFANVEKECPIKVIASLHRTLCYKNSIRKFHCFHFVFFFGGISSAIHYKFFFLEYLSLSLSN